jgi:hypothetical protein
MGAHSFKKIGMGNLASNWRDKILQAVSADVPWAADDLEGLAQELLANVTASGVAIVHEDPEVAGTLVCMVSIGACVPPRAAHVDPSSGISGRCIRERRTQRCYDTRIDPRVERVVSSGSEFDRWSLFPWLWAHVASASLKPFLTFPDTLMKGEQRSWRVRPTAQQHSWPPNKILQNHSAVILRP